MTERTPPKQGRAPKARTGQWKPGQSGNPAGRPKGSGLSGQLRAAIAKDAPAILATLIQAAKSGDVQAARVLLDRAVPALRPVREPVALPATNEAGGLAARAAAVLDAIAAGTLAPDAGAEVLAAIAAAAKAIEVHELEARLRALEERNEP